MNPQDTNQQPVNTQSVDPNVVQSQPAPETITSPAAPQPNTNVQRNVFKNAYRAGVTGIVTAVISILILPVIAFLFDVPLADIFKEVPIVWGYIVISVALFVVSLLILLTKEVHSLLKYLKAMWIVLILYVVLALLSRGGAGALLLLIAFFTFKAGTDLYEAGYTTDKRILFAKNKQ